MLMNDMKKVECLMNQELRGNSNHNNNNCNGDGLKDRIFGQSLQSEFHFNHTGVTSTAKIISSSDNTKDQLKMHQQIDVSEPAESHYGTLASSVNLNITTNTT